MDMQQNPDGSWSKAEPIKASWEKKSKKKWSVDAKVDALVISLLIVFWVLFYINRITLENQIIECLLIICVWTTTIFSGQFRKLFKERKQDEQ